MKEFFLTLLMEQILPTSGIESFCCPYRSRHYPAFFSRDDPEGTGAQAQDSDDPRTSGRPSAQEQQQPAVRFADVGCGFGGLLVKLAPLYPDTLMLGMELRDKVQHHVETRVSSVWKRPHLRSST